MRVAIREAIRDDTLRLEAFLKRRMETSMFLRSNLRTYGIGNTKDDYAMRYFLRERGGAIQVGHYILTIFAQPKTKE